MIDKANEYNALRSEILTWIQVEYTLIGLTAASVATALGFFKDDKSGQWPYFSSALLLVLTTLGCLTAFARAKIMVTSAYIVVFHGQLTDWEQRMKGVMLGGKRAFTRKFFFTKVHEVSLIGLYLVLAVAAGAYPWSLQSPLGEPASRFAIIVFVLSYVAVVFMVGTTWISYDRPVFERAWQAVKDQEEGKRSIVR